VPFTSAPLAPGSTSVSLRPVSSTTPTRPRLATRVLARNESFSRTADYAACTGRKDMMLNKTRSLCRFLRRPFHRRHDRYHHWSLADDQGAFLSLLLALPPPFSPSFPPQARPQAWRPAPSSFPPPSTLSSSQTPVARRFLNRQYRVWPGIYGR
jgi:hypothetical protein